MSEPTPAWEASNLWVRVRIVVAALVFTSLLALLVQRAWKLQVGEAKRLKEMAEDQYLHEIELPARRGRVLDRNGAELAASAEVDSIYANPRQIQAGSGVDAVAQALARPLEANAKEIARRLGVRRYFAWVKRQVTPEQAQQVRDLGLKGVYLTKEPRRYYPYRSLAGPAIGWAGVDGRGLEGIELRYEKELRGSPAEVQGLRDALGREVLPAGLADSAPRGGHDVVTTIDRFIQHRLEQSLRKAVDEHHARAASALVMEVGSGEILAIASLPPMDPNDPPDPKTSVPAKAPRNRAVTDPFEPGSTMKTFTLTGAIEAGVTHPDEKWFCENGSYVVGAARIHDDHRVGTATTTEVLAKSSNICTAKIARRLGKERLHDVLRRFGFGGPTGVDLPGERAGILRPVKRWGEIELATVAFGQGLTATQVQLARGYAAIANGGTLYRPRIVRQIVGEDGRTVSEAKPEGQRIIDEKTARTMRQLLWAVTQKGGTGEKLAMPDYSSGGKTGTAQKVDPATRRYADGKFMASFIGFAPIEAPRLVIVVTVDEPVGIHYGGVVAGPVWREVMQESLRYLGVPPTTPLPPAAPPTQPAPPRAAPPTAEDPAAEGGGIVGAEQADEEASTRDIPDFRGLSIAEALDLARRVRLPIEIEGTGRATRQSPEPGRAEEDARCRVSFSPP